jgi:hypothetical protein
MRHWIKSWWEGEFQPFENDDNSRFLLIGGVYNRHWTSRIARSIVAFLKVEWKWLFGAAMAIAGLWLTFLRVP